MTFKTAATIAALATAVYVSVPETPPQPVIAPAVGSSTISVIIHELRNSEEAYNAPEDAPIVDAATVDRKVYDLDDPTSKLPSKVDVEEITEVERLDFLDAGYRGDPEDSSDTIIYAPEEDYVPYDYNKPITETVVCKRSVDWIGLTTYKADSILIEYNDCKSRAMGGTDIDLMQTRDHERAHATGLDHGEGTPATNPAFYPVQNLGD
jgi:hypothetical protein